MPQLKLVLPILVIAFLAVGCDPTDSHDKSLMIEGTANFPDGTLLKNQSIQMKIAIQGFGSLYTGCQNTDVINGGTTRSLALDNDGYFNELFSLEEVDWTADGCEQQTALRSLDEVVSLRMDAAIKTDEKSCRQFCWSTYHDFCSQRCTRYQPSTSDCTESCIASFRSSCEPECMMSQEIVATTTLVGDELATFSAGQGSLRFDLPFSSLRTAPTK